MKKLAILAFIGLLIVSGGVIATGEWFDLFNELISQYESPEGYEEVKVAETIGEEQADSIWFQIIKGTPYVLADYGNSSTLYSDEGEIKEGDFEGMFEYKGEPAYVKKGALDKIVNFEGQELSDSYGEIKSEIEDYPKGVGDKMCFKVLYGDIEQPVCGGEKPFTSSFANVNIKDISGTPAFIALNDTEEPERTEKAVYYEGEKVMDYNLRKDSHPYVHVIDYEGELGLVSQSGEQVRIEGKDRNLLRNFSIEGNLTGVSEFLTHNQDLYYNAREFGDDIHNFNSSLYRDSERIATNPVKITPITYQEGIYYTVAGDKSGVFKDLTRISDDNRSVPNNAKVGNLYVSNGELVYPWASHEGDKSGVKHGVQEFELNPLMFPFRGRNFDIMAYIGSKKNTWYLLYEEVTQ